MKDIKIRIMFLFFYKFYNNDVRLLSGHDIAMSVLLSEIIDILLQHYFPGFRIEIIALGQPAVTVVIVYGHHTVRVGDGHDSLQGHIRIRGHTCIRQLVAQEIDMFQHPSTRCFAARTGFKVGNTHCRVDLIDGGVLNTCDRETVAVAPDKADGYTILTRNFHRIVIAVVMSILHFVPVFCNLVGTRLQLLGTTAQGFEQDT